MTPILARVPYTVGLSNSDLGIQFATVR
jgi:hypothetical protein